MQHHWATADLFVPQIVTLAGYTVFSGHLVNFIAYSKAEIRSPNEVLLFSESLNQVWQYWYILFIVVGEHYKFELTSIIQIWDPRVHAININKTQLQ